MQSADFLSAVFFYLKEGENLNQNWIVENLNNAFSTWNGKLGELWGLVTTGPQTFKGGAVWSVMQTLHNGMVGIGYALVVLFFAISLCKNTMNFHELKRPEAAIHYFLRFVAAKALVGYGMEIMLNVFSICNGIVTDMADSMGGISEAMVSLPTEMQTAIENVGFLASIPLWLVTILGSLFITVLSFVMILTVYVVVIDEGKKQLIQDTFWAMHEISAEVEKITATPEPTEDEPDPEPVTEYILHITVSSKSVDALADLYRFTQDQRDILHQLLSEEMRPSLLALCGGTTVADGELCWPLPGHTYISCHFGEVDAFGNAGHRGTDIPAPEGTPILAAHSGTVLVSGWNDSYGNQVLLDNGAGLSTRYAHMTQTAVTAGEAVTAGQVIGYVGNTGDSTGFHLHFEVMQNGVRVNPMDMVCLQEKKQ